MAAKSGTPAINALCINLDSTLPFLRSVAYSIAAQRRTRLVWKEDKGAIKYLYGAFFGAFGTPGTAAIESPSDAELVKHIDTETQHRIDVLMDKIEHGPGAVARYLATLEEIRATNLASLQELHADANEINSEIAKDWGKSIVFAAGFKLGATIVVKGMSQIPLPGFKGVGFGYDVIVGTIDDLADAPRADAVVVVTTNAAKEGIKEGLGQGAEKLVTKLNGQPTWPELKHALARARQLEDKLARQIERLASQRNLLENGVTSGRVQDSVRSLSRQVPRNVVNLDVAQKAVVKSAGKAAAAQAVSWGFLASDVMEAVTRYNKTVTAARQ